MPKSDSLFTRAVSKFNRSQPRQQSRRRGRTRRLSAEALEARQMLAADLFINEIMADNDAVIEDPDEAGAFEDWIEIYNAGTSAADLGGMYLTDDIDAATQWQFPAGVTVDAGGYLLVWADGDVDQGDTHASFKLSSGGETAALFDSDGTTLIDSFDFGEQATDVAFGRSPDGGAALSVLETPTPGAANSGAGDSNLAPSANAGGPYYTTTIDTVSLSGSLSSDDDGTIADYAWDFDRDGEYDDATGESVEFSSTTVGTFVVGLQVTDDDGAVSFDTGTIKVSEAGTEPSPWEAVTIDDEAAAFFDDTYVHEVHITFDDADWYDTLYDSHATDVEDPYFEADFVADGVTLEDVGVRFKGNSSFSGDSVKKSFKIDFNEFEDLTFMGLKKLNLNNNTNDPSMLREKLFYDYASNFVEGVGRAVHTKLYVNGEYYGLYTAVEQIDSTFTESRFGADEDGNLYKGTASDDAVIDDPQADFGSDLTYLGTDQADYEDFYELKTNEAANDYSNLIEFIDVLNNTASSEIEEAIEPLLDVDSTLTSLALNNLFVNLDSYSGAAHNYYVYERDDTGQFTHIFWDVNESFGTFTQFVARGQNIVQLDPFWLPEGTPTEPGAPVEDEFRPLAESLWEVDDYSREYLRDLAEMLREGFDAASATARINELADLIRDDVAADPNKPFTTAEFEQNLTSDVTSGRRTIYGLTSFISARAAYLSSVLDTYAEQSDLVLNELMSNNVATAADEAGDFDPWIEIYNNGPGNVSFSGLYLTDNASEPSKWAFPASNIDDGDYLTIWVDGETSEGSNHANFALNETGGDLYLTDGSTIIDSLTYTAIDGDSSLARIPNGVGEPETTNQPTLGQENTASELTVVPTVIFINEIMADNDNTIEDPDEAGAFDDWIELYNPATTSVDLSGFYLTDDATAPTQWQFPAGSTIDAGGYLLIWADDATDQGDNHASFKLSAGGESVLLYNVDGATLVDSITFGEQTTDVSYGRLPDGSDSVGIMTTPTPGASNSGDVAPAEIYINEIMADNDNTIEDPDEAGAFDDWIELYNPATTSVDLSGFYLTDDATAPTQWQFPAGSTIDAGGYLLIWADDNTDQGDNHASFKLSAGGESVLLYNVDGATLVDSITFGEQATDVSYGRLPDGSTNLGVLSTATPGASNSSDYTPVPSKVSRPDSLVGTHSIASDTIPTAIIFHALEDTEISVTATDALTASQSVRIVNENVEAIDTFAGGVTSATLTAGSMYAVIFETLEEARSYAVQSSAQSSAFSTAVTNNFLLPTDTSGDSYTSPIDVLHIVNLLNAGADLSTSDSMLDVNRDGYASPIDVLIVVNLLNARSSGDAEGEAPQADQFSGAPLVASSLPDDPERMTCSSPSQVLNSADEGLLPSTSTELATSAEAFLTPADEHPVTSIVSDEDLDLLALDLSLAALTPKFPS